MSWWEIALVVAAVVIYPVTVLWAWADAIGHAIGSAAKQRSGNSSEV